MSLVGFKAQNHEQQVLVRGARSHVDDRGTTPDIFDPLHARFGFTVDVAASVENAKLPKFYTAADDGLAQSWAGERVWCNPPYSKIEPWVEKAWAADAALVVMLLPANRTEQGWWQRQVEPRRDRPGGGPVRVSAGPPAVPEAGAEAHRSERAPAVRLLPADLGRRMIATALLSCPTVVRAPSCAAGRLGNHLRQPASLPGDAGPGGHPGITAAASFSPPSARGRRPYFGDTL